MSAVDLHIHSTCSDGTLTPVEVVAEAVARGVRVVAIADHDITDGIEPAAAAAAAQGVDLVPAVEINTDYEGAEVHVLGYWIEPAHPPLQEMLARIRNARLERNRQIIARLASVGVHIREERVREIAGEGSVGRPHIAAAIVEGGYAGTPSEAFDRFIGRRGVAYVERYRLTPQEAIRQVRQAGGLPVLAHPAKIRRDALIPELLPVGLAGLEAFHCDHTSGDAAHYLALAKRYGLLVTGGTDSHGPHSDRPVAIGSVPVPDWVGRQIMAAKPVR